MTTRLKRRVTKTNTQTKCFKDPMYVIFLKSRGFKDFKYDMDMDMSDMVVMDMDVVETRTKTKTQKKTNTKCFKDPIYGIFLKIRGFNDFKYDVDLLDMDVMDMDVADTKTNTKCFKDQMYFIFLKSRGC